MKYSAYQIMQILLNTKLNKERIAKERPLQAPFSSTYVVDLHNLSHPDDIKKDIYGKWLHSGSHSDVFLCSYSPDEEPLIEKAAPGASGNNVYSLRRLHSVHPSNTEFRRVLAFLFGTCYEYMYMYVFLMVIKLRNVRTCMLSWHASIKSSKLSIRMQSFCIVHTWLC